MIWGAKSCNLILVSSNLFSPCSNEFPCNSYEVVKSISHNLNKIIESISHKLNESVNPISYESIELVDRISHNLNGLVNLFGTNYQKVSIWYKNAYFVYNMKV